MKALSGSHYSLFSLLQHSHSVANPTISYLLVINCSLANLMQLLSGILKNDFHGAEGTTKFYLLLGGALLHDFAAWYARECIGRQQHDMLVELVEEALQVQHSHIMLQGTVESHRSCRASSFCSEIERFINQDWSAASAYCHQEDRSSWSWNPKRRQ